MEITRSAWDDVNGMGCSVQDVRGGKRMSSEESE
jgi:hypothetical protein